MARLTVDRVPLAPSASFSILSTEWNIMSRSLNLGDGYSTYNHPLHCRWVASLLHCGFPNYGRHLCPPIHTWSRLLLSRSFLLNFHRAHHPVVIVTWGTSFIAPRTLGFMGEASPWVTKSSSVVAPWSTGYCHAFIVMCLSDLIIMLQLTVVTSCNWFCHRSISSSKFEVQELSCSHEIFPSSVGFTRS